MFISQLQADEKKITLDSDVEKYFTIIKELEAQGDSRSIRKMASRVVKPLRDIAADYTLAKRYDEAIQIYQRLYDIHARHYGANNSKAQRFLGKIDQVNYMAGRKTYKPKIDQAMLDERIRQAGGDDRQAVDMMRTLAFKYKEGKAYAKSEALYLRALKIHEQNNMTQAHTYQKLQYELASLYIDQGDYAKAEPYYKRHLNIKDGEEIQVTNRNMTKMFQYAFMLQFTGRYDEVEVLYKKMLAVSGSNAFTFGPYSQEPMVRAQMGELYRRMGAYSKSLEFSLRAYEDYKKSFGELHVITLYVANNLAETYISMGLYDKALPLLRSALEVLSKQVKQPNQPYVDKNYVVPNLALTYIKLGQHAKAETLFKQAITELTKEHSDKHPLISYSQAYLAESYFQQERLEEAAEQCLQALGYAINNKSPYLLAKIYFTLAQVRQKQGKTAEAIFFGKQGVNKLQQIRSGLLTTEKELQKKFIDSQQQNYEILAGWLVDAGRLSEAEQVLAMLKEEEYFQFIRRTELNEGLTTAKLNKVEQQQRDNLINSSRVLVNVSGELNQYQAIDSSLLDKNDRQKITELENQHAKAKKEFSQALLEIRKAFATGGNKEIVAQFNDTAYSGLITRLGDDVALIHYLPLQNDLRIILRTSSMNVAKKITITEHELNKYINEYRNKIQVAAVTESSNLEIKKLSRQLYDWLILPIESDLKKSGIKTLMLYKNGVLRYIPLATLHDGQHYLVEKYALNTFTAAAIDSFTTRTTQNWTVAGMGVSKKYGKFAPLLMVNDELDNIVKTDEADKKGIYSGSLFVNEAFTTTQLKQNLKGQFNVGHIATHYKFTPGTDTDSFLLLGDGTHLSLADLRNDKYDFQNIDLLTLSACETAVSDTDADGREVEGLATLVQRQGAKAIMATLWPVADCSTGQFMQRFYQHRASGLSKAEALRQSQLDFINRKVPKMDVKRTEMDKGCQLLVGKLAGDYHHPYYWASFLLMGNWQ